MTEKTLWIGPDPLLAVGDMGFLVEHYHSTKQSTHYTLRDTPAHTNVSHAPRLWGWCGTYNGLVTSAEGFVRVERVARNGRAFVRQVEGEALRAALEELGYPELAEEEQQ